MPQIKFTDRKIASLPKPTEGQVDYFDQATRGFAIRVSAGGSKSWFTKYVHHPRQRRLTLGQDPAIGLAEARRMALTVKHDLALGIDPAVQRRADREALTFRELAQTYIERHAKAKKRTWKEDERILVKYCRPWHERKAADVSRADVVELLHDILSRGAGIMANRVLACLRKTYNFGLRQGLVEANPCHLVDAPAAENERDRVYSPDELKRLWKAFGKRGLPGQVFKLCLATGQRLREVAGMQWSEIDGDLWTLPGSRTKNRRVHVVPLNDVALELLDHLRPLDGAWVFLSLARPDQPLSNFGRAVTMVRELSGVADFRTHDLRRTCATQITGLGFSQFVVGRLLGHVQVSVTARYDRHQYLKEKREAADAWGRRLRNIVAGGDVVQMLPGQRA